MANEDERGNPNLDPTKNDADFAEVYPEGRYAVVEVMGHVRHTGPFEEVEQFGQKFCKVWPISDHVVGDPVLVGGASIYQFTEVTAEQAYRLTESWDYKHGQTPVAQLPYHGSEDDDDIPFDPAFMESRA